MTTKSYGEIFDGDWNNLRAGIRLAASYKEKWPELIPLFEQISAQNTVFIMIWNMVINRIIYTVDKRKVMGYDAPMFLAENGIDFLISLHHETTLICTVTLQQRAIKYLEEFTGDPAKVILNLEGKAKKSTGEYFHFLQQTVCIETDSEDHPFLFLSYVYDVTYLKKHMTCNLIITTPEESKWWNFNFHKNFLEPVQPLSKQEKKILSLLSEGKGSKEIAEELFISPHTVDTHRRHLLEKTNCNDTTGMITYLKLVGLL
jgi:DNA-binding CsgD family transcriptional regulator